MPIKPLELLIQVRGLEKRYPLGKVQVEALRGVDMDVPRGAFFVIPSFTVVPRLDSFEVLPGLGWMMLTMLAGSLAPAWWLSQSPWLSFYSQREYNRRQNE